MARRHAGTPRGALAGERFPEYPKSFMGEPLGSTDRSWTAAVVLDWLVAG